MIYLPLFFMSSSVSIRTSPSPHFSLQKSLFFPDKENEHVTVMAPPSVPVQTTSAPARRVLLSCSAAERKKDHSYYLPVRSCRLMMRTPASHWELPTSTTVAQRLDSVLILCPPPRKKRFGL